MLVHIVADYGQGDLDRPGLDVVLRAARAERVAAPAG